MGLLPYNADIKLWAHDLNQG